MSTLTATRTGLLTGTWNVDPVHSSVGFSVRHMVVANFRGSFESFEVTLDEDGLRGTVEVGSVDVSDDNLTAHLLSPEFFDAERHPQLVFRSEDITTSGDDLTIVGELTVRGVTKPVTITGTVSGPAVGVDGRERLGLELETVVDRTAFGLRWNAPLPAGGFVLGNDVKLRAELELAPAQEA